MSPPLTPDADEAHRQLAEELSNPIYADPQSWIQDQFRKLLDWLTGDPSSSTALSESQLITLVVSVVAIAAVALWLFMGPLRSERRRTAELLTDEDRNATDLRADAARLASAREWTAATLQLFRALVRSLDERAIIEESPGMTATEAAGRAAPRLPSLADRLSRAATVFDALAYGHRNGSAAQYQEMLDLDDEVARARPELPDGPIDQPASVQVEAVP